MLKRTNNGIIPEEVFQNFRRFSKTNQTRRHIERTLFKVRDKINLENNDSKTKRYKQI